MSNIRLETKFIVVHSSQTTPEQNISAEDLDNASQRWVAGIGYHKIIKRDGTIEDGRDIDTCGVHIEAKGEVSNQNSIAICLIGGKSLTGELDCNYTLAQFTALKELIVELQSQYDKSLVIGHRDVADTPCPNFEISELVKVV